MKNLPFEGRFYLTKKQFYTDEKTNFKQNKTMFRKLIFASLMLMGFATTFQAQEVQRTQPKFWIGISGGANINMYTGTTQTLNSSLMAPAAFHEGLGVGGFGSLLLEYRPIPVVGFMLNLGYDNRGGSFEQTVSPCNCPEDLKTNLSYATIQPSIRISPFGPDFYVFWVDLTVTTLTIIRLYFRSEQW